ncbi:DEAD/DEAH box helicase [Nocardioides sp.]|jgi:ATP-dependent RNA helicase HelY|uniref:DEAD/DEAH box helicase n=1 Tax=Nocardioides sp. TaxID=35761 RepID=UPI002F40B65F
MTPHPVFDAFRKLYEFGLDGFQVDACHVVEEGKGVLVAAPTGSGKTVVGEFAVHLALETRRKCFYTTPIKALSNQKYHDLVARYGADRVGLLTGDTSVNGEAPVVVMTTEVLRNMLYAGSGTLTGLGYVVMDEVHYLADRSRGAVWEEVIIHLPESVSLVSLSATVSNAEEFGEWLETVRGDTVTIVEERRPVPLYQHVLVGRRLLDLFATSDVDAAAGFVKEDAPVNHELMRIARDDWASTRIKDRRTPKGRPQRGGRRPVGNGRRVWIPSRVDVLDRLDGAALLPAIVFIFSRVGCDAAVEQCLRSGIRLTTPEERDEIFAFVEEACADLPDEDRAVLGYQDFLDGLTRGVAAHHAGMLPAFKQCVEQLFVRGLCKAVFATETLALGINMPARTVVLEKLSKWNGETHADITPGEYTQLTGRAGRRGLDVEGHAVVLWQPGMNPSEVAGLASTRTYPLRSSFRPSYNMAVNLVHQVGRSRARELLEMSFAQFQADKAVVGLARQLAKSEDALQGYADAATCELGDFMEYAALRKRVSELEKNTARAQRADQREEVIASLAQLHRGDVIQVPGGKFAGYAVVLDRGTSTDGPRPQVLTAERQARRLSVVDFPTPVTALSRLRIPRQFNARNPQMRRDLASTLRNATHGLAPPPPRRERRDVRPSREEREIEDLRHRLREHPCHACPDREDHARWAERWFRLDRDAKTLQRRVEQRTNTVARQFDRVCDVLETLGYLADDDVTDLGRPLRRIYSELDLVVAEALRLGVFDGLAPSGLAAALSTLVYEARRPEDVVSSRVPGGATQRAVDDLERLWRELSGVELEHRLDFLRRPDAGLAWAAYRWAEGDDLAEVLDESDLTAGDFVRWIKQLIDLCGQVADAAGDSRLRENVRDVVRRIRRGVVAVAPMED